MAVRKLDSEEQLILSNQVSKLTELNQEAIAKGVRGYSYDWQQLSKMLADAINQYQHILNTEEYYSDSIS